MGMLATVINSLALQNAIEKLGVPTRAVSYTHLDVYKRQRYFAVTLTMC